MLVTGFLLMFATEVIGLVVLPAIAATSPGYVTDVLAVAVRGGHAVGDLGLFKQLGDLPAPPTWAVASSSGRALPVPHPGSVGRGTPHGRCRRTRGHPPAAADQLRALAIPTGVALVGLGYSLWRDQAPTGPLSRRRPPHLEPAVAG